MDGATSSTVAGGWPKMAWPVVIGPIGTCTMCGEVTEVDHKMGICQGCADQLAADTDMFDDHEDDDAYGDSWGDA